MKRRLTIAILGTVAAALLLAGVGTLVLARVGTRNASEEELRRQAETTADLVALGTSQVGAVSARDLEAIRSLVCEPDAGAGNGTPGSPPTTASGPTGTANATFRALFCGATGAEDVATTRSQLCDGTPPRVVALLPDDLRRSRQSFCSDPNSATLSALQSTLCNAEVSAKSAAVRQAIEKNRRLLCVPSRREATGKAQLRDTLSRESIGLVVISPDGDVVSGDLPAGLRPNDLQPERLRIGETVSGDNGPDLFAVAPINVGDDETSAIVIQRSANPLRDSVQWFLLAAGATLAFGALVASFLSRRLTRPVREATDVTTRIAAGDLTARLPETAGARSADELDLLAHSINQMAEALERSKGLERQFLMSVSHDLRTPLTSIRGYAEALADGAASDPDRAANVILNESRRLERLVKDLLELAKIDARSFTTQAVALDLGELAGDSVDGFRREVDRHGLSIELVVPPTACMAMADPDRLSQVIANLVENAVKYATFAIGVEVQALPSGPAVVISDDGPGIAEEDLPYVFERLYVASATVKRKEVGSGLGLAIVRELTEAMGGTVHAERGSRAGTRMVVRLPAPPPRSDRKNRDGDLSG